MKTPKFWNYISLINILLLPFSFLYFLCYKIRIYLNKNSYKSKIPIICIGNLIAGGSGKTPICIEIAKYLIKKNKKFCFLSKGYGGNFNNIKKINVCDLAKDVGDESLLLNNYGDVFISKNRLDGLKYINKNFNYDYIIMDDGLQNPTFKKDKIILVIDGNFGFGNNLFLPAGPLRDKLKNIYKEIDLAIIVGEDKQNISYLLENYGIKYFLTKISANVKNENLNKNYVAFCGLGRPEKFKKTLIENKIKIKDFVVFEDHHFYTSNEIKKLKKISDNLITTEKDWIKLNNLNKKEIDFLPISITIESSFLDKIL